MKRQEVYNAWKKQKSQIDIRGNFANEVMSQVYQYEQKKRKPLFNLHWLVELVSAHPVAQAGLVAAGAITGLVRLVFIILMVLSRGDING